MKNKLTHLNDHLFAQMERLSNEDLKGEELDAEMARAKAVSGIAKDIVANARLVLDSAVAVQEHQLKSDLPMLGTDSNGT